MAEKEINKENTDVWAKAVTLFTGYRVPERKKIFETLSSSEKIPLFRMGLKSMGVRAVTPADYTALSGWMTNKGQDYDLVFYTAKGGDGAHGGVRMQRARIVFIGVPADDNGRAMLLDPGSMIVGGTFKGVMGNNWDSAPMAQYIAGAKAALDELVLKGTTRGFGYNDLVVKDVDTVDLASFTRTAQAFDRAKKFFEEQANTLEQWEKSLGKDHASWKGQAAGVFQTLILQVHKNYQNYVDQFGGKNYRATNTTIDGYSPRSTYGDAIAGAQRDLLEQARRLRAAWSKWASTGEHDPHRALLQELNELSEWVIQNNVMQIRVSQGGLNYTDDVKPSILPFYTTTPAFRQHHPEFGDLAVEANWKKVGEKAVARWIRHIDAVLTPAASKAISELQKRWGDAAEALGETLKTKSTASLSEAFQQEQNQLSQKRLDKVNQDLNEKLSGLGNSVSTLSTDLSAGLNSGLSNLGTEFGKGFQNLNADSGRAAEEITKGLNSLGGGLDGLRTGGVSADSPGLPGTTSLNNMLGKSPAFNLNAGVADTHSSLKNSDGSTTKLNSDGSLTTTRPDGSVSLFNPATGMMTTTSRDGKTKSESLDPGAALTNPDGSTTTLNRDGTLTTKFPDGSSTVINPSTGSTVTTQPDGSVSTKLLNPSIGTVTTPGGGTTALNSDGSLTTKFPDGTTKTIDPSTGSVTTTSPDGRTSSKYLDPGAALTNPDGSRTTLNPDGTLTTKFPDGSSTVINPSTGSTVTTQPDGSVSTKLLNPSIGTVTTPGGGTTALNSDGSLTTKFPDGTTKTIDPSTGSVTTTSPDGRTSSKHLDPGAALTNPDGSRTTLNRDGTLTTKFPDGSIQTVGSDGTVKTTKPDGSVTTTDLNGKFGSGSHDTSPLPRGTSTSSLSDLPKFSSFSSDVPGTSTSLNSNLGGLGSGPDSSFEEDDSTPYSGGPLRVPPSNASDSDASRGSGGVPLNAAAFNGMGSTGGMGGMPMGGMPMGGMPAGGSGGGSSNSERVRNVLSGSDGASRRRPTARSAGEEEEMVFTRGGRPTMTSSPYLPMGGQGTQGNQSTETRDRERSSWVPEDEDVWGTDEGGAPAVIGR